MSSGDKILSENYFQHADHFTRILSEKENYKQSKEKDNIALGDELKTEIVDINSKK